ncbi:MAG: tetraacyldisaccharide 4'-kinase [Burkholderiaceae bacterium]|nr:tetraacyldisaccharide 4'-kinase [Burkholderiaceae bacterium]
MAGMARKALPKAWTHRGWIAWLLWPASLVYRVLVALRKVLYVVRLLPTHRVRVPVIVVGNVVAGGAGKTPAVMAIVAHLRTRGLHPGVVSRGYGRVTHDCREVGPQSTALDVGDEPALIAQACGVPVFVAQARVDAVNALLAAHPQTSVIVCDDGLQHYALERDIEICVFDERGVGNGFLLPAGPLREPWPRPVDLVLHSGEAQAFSGYTAQRGLGDQALRSDGSHVNLAELRGHRLIAVAGIARPQRFFDMLRKRGLVLEQSLSLPDHFDFTRWHAPADAQAILLCTQKDAVKLWRSHPQALAVPLLFTPEPAMFAALDALLDATLSSANAAN